MQRVTVLIATIMFAFLSFISCANDKNDKVVKTTTNEVSEIIFIASEKELATATANTNLNSIAISVNFYNTAPFETKFEIHNLVYRVLALKYRPVFLYGQPFDRGLAGRLLRVGDETEDGSGCTPTAWAGIFPQEHDVGKMCGADDKPRNEENFRKWLTSYWNESKDLFLK